jgi:RNA polymerase sigma factor (sigma-70 family)
VRAGDQRAFEKVVQRYERPLLSFCRHMLGRTHEAEDAVQQTFLSAYEALRRDGDRQIALRPWLFTIARNQCLTMLRARRDHAPVDESTAAFDGLSSQVAQRDDLRHLLADLAELPEHQRAALLLSEINALPHREIAATLGYAPSQVRALVYQARTHLAASRSARETPCTEIREQLSTLRGGALRRAPLRRHVRNCPGCTDFEAEVRRQRAAMAIILPVVPSAALKGSLITAAGVSTGASGTLAGGFAVGTGSGVATSLAVKAAVTAISIAAIASTAVGPVHLSLPIPGSEKSAPATADAGALPLAAGTSAGASTGALSGRPAVPSGASMPRTTVDGFVAAASGGNAVGRHVLRNALAGLPLSTAVGAPGVDAQVAPAPVAQPTPFGSLNPPSPVPPNPAMTTTAAPPQAVTPGEGDTAGHRTENVTQSSTGTSQGNGRATSGRDTGATPSPKAQSGPKSQSTSTAPSSAKQTRTSETTNSTGSGFRTRSAGDSSTGSSTTNAQSGNGQSSGSQGGDGPAKPQGQQGPAPSSPTGQPQGGSPKGNAGAGAPSSPKPAPNGNAKPGSGSSSSASNSGSGAGSGNSSSGDSKPAATSNPKPAATPQSSSKPASAPAPAPAASKGGNSGKGNGDSSKGGRKGSSRSGSH